MKTPIIPLSAEVIFGQPYLESADARQVLDLYVPKGTGPFPLVIWIHGGGWAACDRKITFAPAFLEVGLAIASLEYRLTLEGHPFPAQIQDCMAGVAWLKKHGGEHRLDVNHIGISGHSAGAHLSALVLVAGESGLFWEKKIEVQSASLLSSPLDLGRERGKWPTNFFPWDPKDQFSRFFPGGVYDEQYAQWASPSSYLRAGLAPMLIMHGGKDHIVPIGQAEEFGRSATALGAEVIFKNDPEGNHDLTDPMLRDTVRFFQKTLQ